ncbi:hypothetical protein JVT61DRAFT_15226 [Boletus reticuloceps]|uniref:Uncharacterized protein n=1 Tax=Boletus reticuloceps TaxID=495285 RepID=A0A8I3A9Z9_9AGAM|nr:hypothetical protein JVT61DRAFT_15226 [Boletus reticuloceps]
MVGTRICLSSKWQRLVHPEGQPYFVLSGEFAFAIITEANMEDAQTQDRILDGITVANTQLYYHGIKIPPRCELFLELGHDQVTLNYYFVDYIERELFWLEDLCTESLNIPPAASSSHLETEIRRLYWVHLEFFPMHHVHEQQLEFSKMVDDLCDVISHGQADRLTSKTSTFPYTADTCRQFLELLSRKRGQRVDGHTLCYAARLAGAISNQQFVTFYGQQTAQLDRLQEMFHPNGVQHKWLSNAANFLMWGIPLHYTCLLDDLYVNEEVYADQWTRFLSICLADWTSSLSWSLPVLIASLLLANSASPPPPASTSDTIPLRNPALVLALATCAFAKSSTVGFLPSSVAFSLPRAGYLWGIGLLTAQFLFVASQSVSKFVALVAGSVIAAMMLFVLCVIHPEDASMASLFRSLTSLCIPHLYDLEASEDESMV